MADNTIRSDRVAEPEDRATVRGIDPEPVLRWAATLAFVTCAGGFMYVLGFTVGAWLAWLAGILITGSITFPMWSRYFREQGVAADRAEYLDAAGGFVGADDARPVGGASMALGPSRDDVPGAWSDPDDDQPGRPPWQGHTYP